MEIKFKKKIFCLNIHLSCVTNKETKKNGRRVKLAVVELVSVIASFVRDAEHSDIYKALPPVLTLSRAIPVNTTNTHFVTMHFKIP